MKKVLCMLLSVIMCISLVACGGTSSTPSKSEPSLDVKQELVNICCEYSNCRSVKGFEIGTQNKSRIDNGYKVSAKGTYWPVDAYGDIDDKMTFDIEFTATWDGESSRYDIRVTNKTIKSKY